MSRLLLLLGIVLLIVWAVQRGAALRDARRREQQSPPKKPDALAPSTIVPCAHCGVHLPLADALEADGHWYCSRAHAERARHDVC